MNNTTEEIEAMLQVAGNKGDTVIENDVWIGIGAIIMPGVTIGDGKPLLGHVQL